MKVSSLLLVLLASFLIISDCHITIEIEADELNQIGDILQEIIGQQQRTYTRSVSRSAIN